MRSFTIFAIFLLFSINFAFADTPPPGTVKAKTYDGSGNIPITSTGATGALDVNIASSTPIPVTGTVTATNPSVGPVNSPTPLQATQIGGSDGTNLRVLKASSAGVLSVDGSASTQPISAASLPLPTGAATAAGLTTINTTLGSPFQVGGSIGNSSFGISGTLPAFTSTPTFNLGTLNGAATATNQTTMISDLGTIITDLGTMITALNTINTTLGSPFQAGGTIGNSSFGATQGTAANLNATVVTTGGVTIAKDSSLSTINTTLGSPMQNSGGSLTANAGTNLNTSTLALETGGNLASINTKTPALGQALAAASVPVVLTSSQLSTLTPLTSVAVTQGTAASLNATIAPLTNSSIVKSQIQDNSGNAINSTSNALNVNVQNSSLAVTGTFYQATQPISGTVISNTGTPAALTVHQALVTIGTSAVRLTYNGSAPAATRVLLTAQLIGTSAASCYLGSSTVTVSGSTQGPQMFAGQTITWSNDAGDYYAICGTASQSFLIMEQE